MIRGVGFPQIGLQRAGVADTGTRARVQPERLGPMSRQLRLVFALVALGLCASLLPQATYTSASSGVPGGSVLTAWPGWGVQQDLGPLRGTVGRFQVWVSGEQSKGDRLILQASLLDADTRDAVRETVVEVAPADIPAPRIIDFPAYAVPQGQRLLLQLQVAEHENYAIVYRLAAPQIGRANVALNGVADAGDGPLAFAHLWTGSGLRAAANGDPASRVRLALAVSFGALAGLAQPRVAGALRRAAGRLSLTAGPTTAGTPTGFARVLSTPWYPWPAAAIPILHFLTNNPLYFNVSDAVVPLGVALAIVTGCMGLLRLWLKDWYRPALAVTGVIVVFFGYGHLERALDGRINDRDLFAGAVVLGAAMVAAAVRAGSLDVRRAQFLNFTAAVLLVFSLTGFASGACAMAAQGRQTASLTTEELMAHLPPLNLDDATAERPDIYYIILDSYGRDGGLGQFDNSEFLQELDRRGFYVASKSTSNYTSTIRAISSLLNMAYLEDLGERTPATDQDLVDATRRNALVSILRSFGYTYVHLASGFELTDQAPDADIFVTFAPAGVIASDRGIEPGTAHYAYTASGDSLPGGRFLHELILTTALRPIASQRFAPGDDEPYGWWAAPRTLQMFNFLSAPLNVTGPKFVFAHIVKPHPPATFDRHGNRVDGVAESYAFGDDHDPSVPNAYIGQLIYINALVLSMIDDILRNADHEPIIVIASDHGSGGYADPAPGFWNATLAAFHLPNGGNDGMYPSISSVNHFRYILDFYFNLGLGLLEDRTI